MQVEKLPTDWPRASQQGAGEGGLQGRAGVTAVVCGQVCVTGVSPELG